MSMIMEGQITAIPNAKKWICCHYHCKLKSRALEFPFVEWDFIKPNGDYIRLQFHPKCAKDMLLGLALDLKKIEYEVLRRK